MEKIFDIAKDKEQSWGTLATAIDGNGVHCAEGLPMYCASCCYYQALFAPRYGISIFGNTLRLTSSAPHAINVTDSNAPIAQKAAISSCCNMWECINPETIEL